jgi:hypothetical protein
MGKTLWDINFSTLNASNDSGDITTIHTTGQLLKERIQHNSPMFARVA